jgi:hypothetical protein
VIGPLSFSGHRVSERMQYEPHPGWTHIWIQ